MIRPARAFIMIGLGLGSLLGGWLSARYQSAAIFIFALAELGTAAFGLLSLRIFHWAALHTAGAPLGYVVPLSLGLLLLPTMCMSRAQMIFCELMSAVLKTDSSGNQTDVASPYKMPRSVEVRWKNDGHGRGVDKAMCITVPVPV